MINRFNDLGEDISRIYKKVSTVKRKRYLSLVVIRAEDVFMWVGSWLRVKTVVVRTLNIYAANSRNELRDEQQVSYRQNNVLRFCSFFFQCRDIGGHAHEEILKVLNELQSVSRTQVLHCFNHKRP